MKIPYGLSNFKDIVEQDYLYIDKTAYIEKLEQQGKFNILLRPRRFGKSLFLSTMQYYYDIRYRDTFDTLFANLSIGSTPTPLKNSYQILFMDFSGISAENEQTIQRDFSFEVTRRLRIFLEDYQYQTESIQLMESQPSPASLMKAFFEIIREQKIYILIDEYDHFANAVLGNDLTLYKQIIGKGGFVRSFYETIKTATMEGIVDRFFITGITSITLDSLTSGFNIGDNISQHRHFNEALGFTDSETATILRDLTDCLPDQDQLMQDMRRWYNGYLFSEDSTERVYNPDMVLYFAKHFDLETCQYPKRMLDANIASDYSKIIQFFSIGDCERNYRVLERLLSVGRVTAEYKDKIDIIKKFDRDDFITLLFSMGFITILEADLEETAFTVPNHVIMRLYFEYFKVELEQRSQISINSGRLKKAVRELALQGDIVPLTVEIKTVLSLLSNRDFMNMDEKHIKVIVLTLLYQSKAYYIKSEPEMNKRYPDILLLERNPIKANHQFLFELKYCKKKDGNRAWRKKKEEGIRQVEEYLRLEEIQGLRNLKSYLLLTDGSELEAVAVG
ncbi:MAG: AAA family ATPase [Candidatus Electrothrix sp. Rat3]|nr:AAA family ATPase [Candidatus Electrothrix rattekaaiensis]